MSVLPRQLSLLGAVPVPSQGLRKPFSVGPLAPPLPGSGETEDQSETIRAR